MGLQEILGSNRRAPALASSAVSSRAMLSMAPARLLSQRMAVMSSRLCTHITCLVLTDLTCDGQCPGRASRPPGLYFFHVPTLPLRAPHLMWKTHHRHNTQFPPQHPSQRPNPKRACASSVSRRRPEDCGGWPATMDRRKRLRRSAALSCCMRVRSTELSVERHSPAKRMPQV